MSKEKGYTDDDVTIVPTGCCHDCGGRCVLRAHVKGGKIIRFETDNGDQPQIRACLRGRAYRQRIYHPERLKYPLRRIGERGEGKSPID
jgi:anaerobic dimethyl sulfoxide reductase subunit A